MPILNILNPIAKTGTKQYTSSDPSKSFYAVKKINHQLKMDAVWNKPEWKSTKALLISNFVWNTPSFKPKVEAKLLYDNENIYVIFKVQDKYVRSITTEVNGDVWEDACLEFFFSPNKSFPNNYFNLEINAGGTPLMHYNEDGKIYKPICSNLLAQIEIAHSLPEVVEPEISKSITWFLEYKIPLKLLQEYSDLETPEKGVIWKANFYKIAENNSNPHYITWSPIKWIEGRAFHQPIYFGNLEFQ